MQPVGAEGNIQENALADFTVPSVSGPLALKCECVEASAYLSHYLASYSSTFFRRGKIWGTRSMLQRKLHNSWWGMKVLHNINPSSVYKNDQQKWNLIKIDHLLPVAISRLSSVLCNYLLATGSLKIMVGQKLHLRAIKRHQIKF